MKPTSYEIEFANELIEKLMQHHLKEGLQYCQNLNGEVLRWYEWVDDFRSVFNGTNFYSGATKICIEDKRLGDWVLKVGFDRSTCEYYREHENANDYCELEMENYQKACKENFEKYFAETYFFKEVDGVKFFWQEKVRLDEDSLDKCSSEYCAVDSYFDELDDDDRIMSLYGDTEEVNDFINFLDDNGINDLHSENWGWTKDGRVVAIDFSGYVG